MAKHQTHNWKLTTSTAVEDAFFWECQACGIGDWDKLASYKCLNFKIIPHLIKKIVEFKNRMLHKLGMFILRFSK